MNQTCLVMAVEKTLGKPEAFMVRHKATGEYIHEGMTHRSLRGGKVWRSRGTLNSAISQHTKYLDDPRVADFCKNPQDYEVIILREVDHMELTQWFEWRSV